jgi:hypothetical protein
VQWLQDLSQINGDNLNNVRCEAVRHFMNGGISKRKNKWAATHSKTRTIEAYAYKYK